MLGGACTSIAFRTTPERVVRCSANAGDGRTVWQSEQVEANFQTGYCRKECLLAQRAEVIQGFQV